ncbi:hypothetical protein [Rhodococcus xishaensis]|uniref:Uncharacterized protein n=1 Tax=Rhodococcus xishaensis TaxID=2487364 RepID=A0A438AWC6_9NOCA|nr:hypothetical protein [Rhodococcus xishaensis]RVW03023.1 hypothetical protein EGT50_09955 [Rhodococcus xishaensis]
MITDDDKRTAALVLAKCAANDPWFPNGGDSTVLAWADVFADSGLSRDDLLAGVSRAYRVCEDGFKPLPAAIIKHARLAYVEALQGLSKQDREAMDEACHILQDMGWRPPEAHRWVRAVKAGRRKPFELTAEQEAEFRERIAQRRALPVSPGEVRAMLEQSGVRDG